jgi:signal transduction histidine kinase
MTFDERLAERTRIARELVDALLQTIQGSKLVADHALKDSDDHERLVRAVIQISSWLGQATEEGRAALQSLRESTTQTDDLAEAFRRAIDECRIDTAAAISFVVEGAPREIDPMIRDETYRIGYEAIRNACVHSSSRRIEVTLAYGHDLMWRITDDGGGIAQEIVEEGRPGHFGLRGMKERAERIGATLTLESSPNAGTTVKLVVPGRIAFRTTEGEASTQR